MGPLPGIGDLGQDGVALGRLQGTADPSGDDPRRVDPLPTQPLDDPLAEATQGHAVTGEVGRLAGHTHQVAQGRVGVEPEQEIGGREVEEAQRVRLDDLGQIEHAAQPDTSRGHGYPQDLVTGFGRGHHVADRADAADPRHEGRHLVNHPALADPLETAELGHMKVGVGDLARIVQLDGDLGVPLDPGHGLDDDGVVSQSRSPPR